MLTHTVSVTGGITSIIIFAGCDHLLVVILMPLFRYTIQIPAFFIVGVYFNALRITIRRFAFAYLLNPHFSYIAKGPLKSCAVCFLLA